MSLPNPILDDRSYLQLRNELLRRIPVYAEEWTDHNLSDPGIALLELFAFLGENLLFRFNQIPEAAKLEFLRLLQIPLRPAAPARALVTLSNDKPRIDADPFAIRVPQETECRAGKLVFETRTEVSVWPVSCVAVGRLYTPDPDPTSEQEVYEFWSYTRDIIKPDDAGNTNWWASYSNAIVPSDAGGEPVDFGKTVDRLLWVAVLGDARLIKDHGKSAVRGKLAGGLLNLGFVPDSTAPVLDDFASGAATSCPGANAEASNRLVEWQVAAGNPDPVNPDKRILVYRSLAAEGDTTGGLVKEGVVRLRLPASNQLQDFTVDLDHLGTGEYPPLLDDASEQRILFWLRAFRRDRSDFGRIQFIGVNAAEVRQTAKAFPEFLGVGNGQPRQQFNLSHKPTLQGSLVLEVEEGGIWRPWTETDGFFTSLPDDRHYLVDHQAGQILFGTGLHGFPPPIGARIRAVGYRYGGGSEGNVPPQTIAKLPDFPSLKISNPLRANGGSDPENLESGLERIPGELRRRDRAVTTTDFQELALMTPGVEVGRAECLPRFHPMSLRESPPLKERPGVVSVVVWPSQDAKHPSAPVSDNKLLRAVCTWLDTRRLVTTELYVLPPTYRKIAVSVGIKVKSGYGIEAVRRWVELVIRQYLAPLPPYGPEGGGWPLGRRVHGPELEAAALQVEGVEYLELAELQIGTVNYLAGLHLAELVDSQWIPRLTVELMPYEVPELAAITVVDGKPEEPGKGIVPPPVTSIDGTTGISGVPLTPVPLPIVREEC